MNPFAYDPSDHEIEELARLATHPGYQVFRAIMLSARQEIGIRGLKEMGRGDLPEGFYAGYIQSIEETLARVDNLVKDLSDRRLEAAQRAKLGAQSVSQGDTTS